MTKAERRVADAVNEAYQSTLAHLHGLDRSISQLQDMLEQMIDLREQTIRQANRDVIHQWRTERGTEKITGVIRTSWREPDVVVDES